MLLFLIIAVAWYQIGHQGRHIEYKAANATTTITLTRGHFEVDALDGRIQDALTASSSDVEARAGAAYTNAKHQAEVEIKLQVTSAYRAELEKREKALQKESVTY